MIENIDMIFNVSIKIVGIIGAFGFIAVLLVGVFVILKMVFGD